MKSQFNCKCYILGFSMDLWWQPRSWSILKTSPLTHSSKYQPLKKWRVNSWIHHIWRTTMKAISGKKKKKSNEIIFVWFCFCRWTHYQLKRSAIGENNQWENQLPWPWKYLHVAYRCITWWLFIITHHGSYYCLTKKKTETNKLKCR